MNITFTPELTRALRAAELNHENLPESRYGGTAVPIDSFEQEYLDKLATWAKKDSTTHNGLLQKLSMWKTAKLKSHEAAPKVLAQLQAMIHAEMLKLPNRLMFTTGAIQEPVIYVKSKYTQSDRDTPASVSVTFQYYARGSVGTLNVNYYQDDVTGNDKTVLQMFLASRCSLTVETPELVEEYHARMADYQKKQAQLQQQFLYTTSNLPSVEGARYYERDTSERARAGTAVYRVVNDDNLAKVSDMPVVRVPSAVQRDGEDRTDVFQLPIWPRIHCYNLEVHGYMWIEPWLMEAYQYDADLVNRLIIPPAHKDLLKLLTENPDTLVSDFVSGKSGGTIIICHGPAGLGKTMAAEAYAEGTNRILYRVQSDQLGMTPESIEKALKDIFVRAERWDAVLLLDEADIYIRTRGYDMAQNAVVGSMLRMIEYYNGTLMMTTNLINDCDDAIKSRASAVLGFEYPTHEHATIIYRQFAELFDLTLSDTTRDHFIETYRLSGRSIKSLLRLAARMGIKAPTVEELERVLSVIHHDVKE